MTREEKLVEALRAILDDGFGHGGAARSPLWIAARAALALYDEPAAPSIRTLVEVAHDILLIRAKKINKK